MIIRVSRLAVPLAALAVLSGVVSCTSTDQTGPPDGRLTVVASTDVWAGVVRAVAGDAVEIRTIIDDPAADPHSYQVGPADAAEVTNADLVVFNGGGYDGFVEQLLARAGNRPAIEAVALETAGTNEHVWYDLPVVAELAGQVAGELSRLAPEQAPRFAAGAETFRAGIDELNATLSALADRQAGARVAMTEPVAHYLIKAAGLDDATPPEFLEAVEEETDPPAAAVAATRDLLAQRQVRVLIYNPQTETPVTLQIRADAEAAGIPLVVMTETLPEGTDYLGWMAGQIDALTGALG